jgi:hypothetical protein
MRHSNLKKTTRQFGKTSTTRYYKNQKKSILSTIFHYIFFFHNEFKSKNQLLSHKNNTKSAPKRPILAIIPKKIARLVSNFARGARQRPTQAPGRGKSGCNFEVAP